MTTKQKLITADEFLMMPRSDGRQYELVQGVLSEKVAASLEHNSVSGLIYLALAGYVIPNDYGEVAPGDTGFRLASDPDTVRAPDVVWIAPGRVTAEEAQGFPALVPDLVVEVKSPSNSYAYMAERAAMWLAYGAREVWNADYTRLAVTRYRPGHPPETLGETDTLDGGALLPGFSVPVWRLFRRRQ